MENVLIIKDVSKVYKPTTLKSKFNRELRDAKSIVAVDKVSFEIHAGEIYGLLGPNGAGKSTIIKMITGLIRKDAGQIVVAGHDIDKEREEASSKIGAIIEAPALFRNMSALDNLRYFASLEGNVDENKIKVAIDTVGLSDRANDKVQTYSMGMKQRLSIAQAIMSSPKLLVLDEPTNGLDPEWIINIRELVRKLAREYNVAVLVSSHILGEMQELCDRVGIIYNGVLVGETDVAEIEKVGEDTLTIASFETADIVKTYDFIKERYEKVAVKNSKVFVQIFEKEIPVLTRELVMNGIDIYGVDVKKKTLEDLFKTLVLREKEKRGGDTNAD